MLPDYQKFMLPVLQVHADEKEYNTNTIIEALINHLKLTEEQQKEMLPSGTQSRLYNRVGWVKVHLSRAGLLQIPRRGYSQITELGKDILKQNPPFIDNKFLLQFPSFVEFQHKSNKGSEDKATNNKVNVDAIQNKETPEERLEDAHQEIMNSLANELLERILELSPTFFEKLVIELLVKMGYGGSVQDAGKALGKSGDEGVDGVIKEDKLGLDAIYLQAKRWDPQTTIGRPEIQKFVGALIGKRARKGVFITTSSFTKEAKEYASSNDIKVVLIDGEQLTQLMIEHNLGCSTQQAYEVKKIDNDYFDDI